MKEPRSDGVAIRADLESHAPVTATPWAKSWQRHRELLGTGGGPSRINMIWCLSPISLFFSRGQSATSGEKVEGIRVPSWLV